MNRYFDNAAAETPAPGSLAEFTRLAETLFANQEAAGADGLRAADAVKQAASELVRTLCGKCSGEYGAIFLHTGTDAVNTGITAAFGAAGTHTDGGPVLTTGAEHASVDAVLGRLSKKNFSLFRLNGGPDGGIRPDQDFPVPPALAAIHFVQSETGAVQDLAAFRKKLPPHAVLFVDSVQGIGKVPFDVAAIRPDLFTVSGQKLGAPGGAALVYRKNFEPALKKFRSAEHLFGRVPPAFCVLLAAIVKQRIDHLAENAARAATLKTRLFARLAALIPGRFRPTLPEHAPQSPYIAHLLLTGKAGRCQGAIVVRALSEIGFSAAAGSACDAESDSPSAALLWTGISKADAFSALRVSFSPQNGEAGVDALADAVARTVLEY